MIKFETIGTLENAANDPTVTSDKDVRNNSLVVVGAGDEDKNNVYLVCNEGGGDESRKDGRIIKAGEPLNAYSLKSLNGRNLVVDVADIGVDDEAAPKAGDILEIQDDGSLKKDGEDSESGVYLKVVDADSHLLGKAVVAQVVVEPLGK